MRVPIVVCLSMLALACGAAGSGKPPGDAGDVPQDLSTDVRASDVSRVDSGRRGETAGDATDTDLAQDVRPEAEAYDSGQDAMDVSVDVTLPFPALPVGPGVVFNLQSEPPMLPFPWDWFTREVPGAASGIHLAFDEQWRRTALLAPLFALFSGYEEDSRLLDGFGSAGIIVLPFSTALDPSTLPETTGPGAQIEVLAPAIDGPDASLPYRVSWLEVKKADGTLHTYAVQLEPVHPLQENSRYLVLVRAGLKDAEGTQLERYPLMDVVLGLQPPYGPPELAKRMVMVRDATLDALNALDSPPAPEEFSAAIVFTTGTMTADMLGAGAFLESQDVVVDLDPDGDGVDNVLPADQFFGSAPAGLATVVEGRFEALDYRLENGYLGPDEQGVVQVRSKQWRNFFLFIPEGEGPFPVVVVQHGLNSWKETMYGVAKELASRGIGAAGFDFVHHSKEDPNGGFWFLKIDVPRETVGNFRQSMLDMITFFRALEVLSGSMDLAPPEGDGLPDLDFSRVVFTGHSLGAITSSVACTLSTRTRAGAFVAGAGNFGYVFLDTIKILGLFNLVPPDALLGFTMLAEHFMSRADPMVFASMLKTAPHPANGPCPFLLELGMQDETLPPASGQAEAFATGQPLLDPVLEEWDGIPVESAAGLDSGTVQFQGGHSFFFSGQSGAAARGVYYHYVETFLKTGQFEILWPQP